MQDKMQQREGVAIRLECGHPNKHAGELCELCGETVPQGQESTSAEEPIQEH